MAQKTIRLLADMIPTVADIDARSSVLKSEVRLLAQLRKLAEKRDIEAQALGDALSKCEKAVQDVLVRNGIVENDDAA